MFITKNMFIYLIYLGLPILGRVIPTALWRQLLQTGTSRSPIRGRQPHRELSSTLYEQCVASLTYHRILNEQGS